MKKEKPHLTDRLGRRTYLNDEERLRFIEASYEAPAEHRTLALVLSYTGCQLIEALALTAADIDMAGDAIYFAAGDGASRGVPVGSDLVELLDAVHSLGHGSKARPLWDIDRTCAWRWISKIMKRADLVGPKATPRGLRHGFALQAVRDGVPLDTLQRWLGHVSPVSTAVYYEAVPRDT